MNRVSLNRYLTGNHGVLWGLLFLATVYGLTATWGLQGQTRDSMGTILPAWSLVERGSLELEPFKDFDAWIGATGSGYYSNRSPGLVFTTALGYLLSAPFTTELVAWPATLVAIATSLGAVAAIASIEEISRKPSASLFCMVLLGLGTAMWGISADQIWPHGPGALSVALALWFVSRERLWLAGAMLGLGILIRPPIAVLAAVLGSGLALTRKSLKPILSIGIPSGIGAALLTIYNYAIFGSTSPTAGYEGIDLGEGNSVMNWLGNTLSAWFSPRYGLLLWSSWIAIAIALIPRVWKRTPDWMRWAALGGAAYVLVHTYLNRASGGLPYNYRYPLEGVVFVAPLTIVALKEISKDRLYALLAVTSGSVAVILQGLFSIVAVCYGIGTGEPACDLLGGI